MPTTKRTMRDVAVTQKEKRLGIDVGPGFTQVSPVAYWYKQGRFQNDDEARGAFFLAYQQGLDGMGESIQQWMGLTQDEFDAWMRDSTLPARTHGA